MQTLAGRNEKYLKSGINAQQSEIIFNEIKHYLETSEAYLEHDLSLPKLSVKLEFSTNIISQAINETGGLNFFDFINQYRVNKAKVLLGNIKIPISNIPYAAGFKSKTTFYSAFKRFCKCTPKEYRQTFAADNKH
ncbi:helix-turn-helix transcriptional regulator [Paraneptunicella aestuarii]|uniref:helix-turn-helix domain-containing protein n=1 Tax=Paraneptunicella aestuarii TaxID=2831148 RepID=UPI001E410514|nr:AraC family transcriptional regulator [Paraneptunicella aestuarii]UAA40005.1 helix-turn-helix transcriptional regulator [Paraneptunicella aestuarii]